MNTKSAKAKGRRLAQWMCDELNEIDSEAPVGYVPNVVSLPGTDIQDMHNRLPWGYTECRNRETWQSLEELVKEMEKKAGTDWVAVLGKNRRVPVFLVPTTL